MPQQGVNASRSASLRIGRGSVGLGVEFGVLGVECGGNIGGHNDPLARLSVEAAFPDLDPAVLQCSGELLGREAAVG